nr:MFS-transporter [Hydrogenophaga sp.]
MLAQVAINAAMAGVRLALPLQALQSGRNAWSVGLLLALFTLLPVLTAIPTGRLTDRRGYHRPLQLAVALTVAGSLLALLAVYLPGEWQFAVMCLSAAACGSGANVCGIATQRTGGKLARNAHERLRYFSWLGMAPAVAAGIGPVLIGVVIDRAGYGWAYALMATLPLIALLAMRVLPRQAKTLPDASSTSRRGRLSELMAVPGLPRLLFVNWLLSASWDVHSFAVPLLGHARQFSASTIGMVLGVFTLAVALVRLVIPLLAHRIHEVKLLRGAMLVSALILLVYPYASSPWQMTLSAALLGLALGAVQPTVVSMLYMLSPPDRQGEVMAFRSMAISVSNSAMPLVFGLVGSLLGPAVMFWMMGAVVGAGSWAARGLKEPQPAGPVQRSDDA